MREEFDAKIMTDFRKPFMAGEGYTSWDDVMEDYGFEHAGDLLATCMVMGTRNAPTPDRFYEDGYHDDLHGLMDVTYEVRDGRPGYVMDTMAHTISRKLVNRPISRSYIGVINPHQCGTDR